jgi:signal transduction histidine kinase
MANEEIFPWQKRFERERSSRKNAEKLLEDKSLEIWEINQNLEKTIALRTKELESALAEVKNASKAKDAFLSSMSHELRTPLNAIIGFSQILMVRPDTGDNAKGFIEKIQIAGKTLLSLVNTILDFSKMESGKMECNPAEFEFRALFYEVNIIVEPMLLKKKLSLIIHGSENVSLIADMHLIKQALINLISNAIKFSPNNGAITVSCSANTKGTDAVISVSDQGEGVPPEKIELLFQPFSQLANAKTIDEAGTGLGLMIIKKIADTHNGEAGVENVAPHGAKFWISIPQKKEHQ